MKENNSILEIKEKFEKGLINCEEIPEEIAEAILESYKKELEENEKEIEKIKNKAKELKNKIDNII